MLTYLQGCAPFKRIGKKVDNHGNCLIVAEGLKMKKIEHIVDWLQITQKK